MDQEQGQRPIRPSAKQNAGGAGPRPKRSPPPPGEDRQSLLLQAARSEFAVRGLAGARVDTIAQRSGANKQLVYHYFGSKDDLYLAVLEDAYHRFAERFSKPPRAGTAAQRLTEYIRLLFDSLYHDKEFLSLVTDQNLYSGQHIRQSKAVKSTLSPLVEQLSEILKLARREGVLKLAIDPIDLYITISGICSFYFTNSGTLTAALGRQFESKPAIASRREHVVEFVLAALFGGPQPASDS